MKKDDNHPTLNEEFILKCIEPYLNTKREISMAEFLKLFSEFSLHEQYEVVSIMISHDIDLVDEKAEESSSKSLENRNKGDGYWKLLNLTNEELAIMAKQGDNRATAAILYKNQGAVRKMALEEKRKFIKTNLTEEDFQQAGYIGVLIAIQGFDPSLGYKFLTYCEFWMKQQMERVAVDTGFLIRPPVHIFEQIVKVTRCRMHNPLANNQELISLLVEDGISEGRAWELLKWSELYLNTTSLNALIGEEDDTELQDLIPDKEAVGVEDKVIATALRESMEKVMNTLTARERTVLRLRFGFDGRSRTLEEVGDLFNVTRERIRQIEAKALRKLRHPSRSKNIKDYL